MIMKPRTKGMPPLSVRGHVSPCRPSQGYVSVTSLNIKLMLFWRTSNFIYFDAAFGTWWYSSFFRKRRLSARQRENAACKYVFAMKLTLWNYKYLVSATHLFKGKKGSTFGAWFRTGLCHSFAENLFTCCEDLSEGRCSIVISSFNRILGCLFILGIHHFLFSCSLIF